MNLNEMLKAAQEILPTETLEVCERISTNPKVYGWKWSVGIITESDGYNTICGSDVSPEDVLTKMKEEVARMKVRRVERIALLEKQLAKEKAKAAQETEQPTTI